jgi:hypothetical protein
MKRSPSWRAAALTAILVAITVAGVLYFTRITRIYTANRPPLYYWRSQTTWPGTRNTLSCCARRRAPAAGRQR